MVFKVFIQLGDQFLHFGVGFERLVEVGLPVESLGEEFFNFIVVFDVFFGQIDEFKLDGIFVTGFDDAFKNFFPEIGDSDVTKGFEVLCNSFAVFSIVGVRKVQGN